MATCLSHHTPTWLLQAQNPCPHFQRGASLFNLPTHTSHSLSNLPTHTFRRPATAPTSLRPRLLSTTTMSLHQAPPSPPPDYQALPSPPPEPMIKVLLVGSGAIGTMAAYALEKGGKASVTAVLRSSFEIVKNHGFSIDSVEHGKITAWRPTKSK